MEVERGSHPEAAIPDFDTWFWLLGRTHDQAQRIMHWFWRQGRPQLAYLLQSRVSEVFGMDLHPAAVLGKGLMIDHASGVVIGETARVSLLDIGHLSTCPLSPLGCRWALTAPSFTAQLSGPPAQNLATATQSLATTYLSALAPPCLGALRSASACAPCLLAPLANAARGARSQPASESWLQAIQD